MKKLFALLSSLALIFAATSCSEPEEEPTPEPTIETKLSLSTTTIQMPSEGGVVEVVVSSNKPWSLETSSTWITPSITEGEANEEGTTVSFEAEMADEGRTAEIHFSAGDRITMLTIFQNAYTFVASSDSEREFSLPAAGGLFTIYYEGNVPPIFELSEGCDWITIPEVDTDYDGYKYANVTATVEVNTTTSARSATISMLNPTSREVVATYTVNQECAIVISYTTTDGNPIGGENTLAGYLHDILYENGVGAVLIYDEIASIPFYAFRELKNLETITIPEGITQLEEGAFWGCSNLKEVRLPESCTSLGASCFSNCSSLTTINLPEALTEIGSSVFMSCSSLAEVKLPAGLTVINMSLFAGCSSLTHLDLHEGITFIGDWAFQKSALETIILPESLEYIGWDSLSTENIKNIYSKPTTPPEAANPDNSGLVFDIHKEGVTVYVPTESVEAYKAHPMWSLHKGVIVGYDFE